jgi:hypothetical protein
MVVYQDGVLSMTPAKATHVGLYSNCLAREVEILDDPIQEVHTHPDDAHNSDAGLPIQGSLRVAHGASGGRLMIAFQWGNSRSSLTGRCDGRQAIQKSATIHYNSLLAV